MQQDIKTFQATVETALQPYSIDLQTYKLLQGLGNLVFRITSTVGEHFCLRVYEPETAAAEVQAELMLLASLAAQGMVDVPVPIKTTEGQLWTHVVHQNDFCLCALFQWIEGDDLETIIMSQELATTFGATIARLHNAMQMLSDSNLTSHRHYTRSWLSRITRWVTAEHLQDPLNQNTLSVLNKVKDEILADMMMLEPDPCFVGWIHADLHLSNLVVNSGRVYPIDFESVGWGYYVFDIAAPLFEVVTQPNGAALRQSLLDGYSSVRPLPVAHEQQIDRFIMARAFAFVNWILTAPNDAVRRRYQHLIPQAIALIQTLNS